MKKKLGFVLLSLLATAGFASYKQTIEVCGDVNSFRSPYQFRAHFESSDVLDWGFDTENISNGKLCVSHVYSYGPKKIKIALETIGHSPYPIRIINEDCKLTQVSGSRWESKQVQTSAYDLSWTIHIIQTMPQNGFPYVYRISCERTR